MLLFTAVNNFWGLNAAKSFGNPNRVGVAPPAFALTRKPVPAVLNTTPRGELTLKKSGGSAFGSEKPAGTPSQLISRRTPPNEPFAPATVPPPIAARNASRVGVMLPLASKVVNTGTAQASEDRSKPTAVAKVSRFIATLQKD